MKRTRILLFTIFSLAVLSGCTTPMQKYWLNSQFYQSAQYFEKNLTMEQADPDDIYFYCLSLFELKNFEKFNQCEPTFISRTQSSDTLHRTSRDALAAELLSFKARQMIDLGVDLKVVQKTVDDSLAFLQKASPNFHNGFKVPEIHVYETAGILSALRGDRVNALEYIGKIKGVTSMAEFQLRPIKNAAIAGIYFILKEYAQAKKVIDEYSGSVVYAFSKAVMTVMVFPLLIHYADLGPDTSLDAITERGTLLSEFMAAKILFETGHLEEAQKGYEALLAKKISINYERIRWACLADLASIYEKKGRWKESIDLLEKAVELIETQRKNIFSEGSKIGFIGDKQAVYHALIRNLFTDQQYGKAFEYVERAKSRALVDLLASKNNFIQETGNERRIQNLLNTQNSVDKAFAAINLSSDAEKTRSIQIKIKEELRTKAPDLASLVTVSYLPASRLFSLISSEEALVEYYYFGEDWYIFILSDSVLKAVKLDGRGLAEEIAAYRQFLETPRGSVDNGLSQRLYERLFKPVRPLINKRNLIIVPHGALHYLPMSALYDGNRYLIDEYSFRTIPSADTMAYLGEKKGRKDKGLLVFGSPDLGDPRFDLEFARKEALAVAATRQPSKVLLGKEASESALQTYGPKYGVIHFATHGRFDPVTPLNSALLLAPDAHSNGMLTVDKLYSLRLDADMVTLSACETGLSQLANGDDLIGLIRGFLFAGSSTIVASLWMVNDLATADLMILFYEELDKSPRSQALRTAQLKIREKFPHPYYWASFQVIGHN
jgi:CHAT domain-containing protein